MRFCVEVLRRFFILFVQLRAVFLEQGQELVFRKYNEAREEFASIMRIPQLFNDSEINQLFMDKPMD